MSEYINQSQRPPIVPFLKWAGGKRWLISDHSHVFPRRFNSYIEPFLGSAAVFFHLLPDVGILADQNAALIETYSAIKFDWENVESILRGHHRRHSHEHYYQERARVYDEPHKRAAQFIYLNRTCWNGLYRVNLKGKFNVPIGTKSLVTLPTDNFGKIAKALKKISLRVCDFETSIEESKRGDFVFIDPPYTVKHNMNGFIKYNENIFSWDDQIRLRDTFCRANERGVLITATNADHHSVRELYNGHADMESLNRHSVLAGKSSARIRTTELLITNWQ